MKVWEWIGRDKKGSALVFTMFVVISVALLLANDYSKGVRQERQIGRAIKRIQAKGVERFVVDRGVRLLKDYVQATGSFPDGTGSTPVSAAEDAPGISAGQTFKEVLIAEYASWKTRMTTGASPSRTIPWIANMAVLSVTDPFPAGVDFICSNIVSSSVREYLMTFSVTHSDTGAQQRISQKILVSIGKLYDYSIFYAGDLEIQAALGMSLYGPIYAAGDVYLLTGNGTTLSITAASDAWTEAYALQSSGNIYFGPKRAIAKNYFLSDNGGDCAANDDNCFNSKYAKAIKEELRTHDSNYYDSASRVEVRPNVWTADQKAFRQWVDHVKGSGTAPAVKNPLMPYFYYFMNELWYGPTTSTATTTHTISIAESSGGVLANFSAPSSRVCKASLAKDNSGDATSYVFHGRAYYTEAVDYDAYMSISSAYDPANPPQLVGETGSDRKPVTNPDWSGVGSKVVWDNAPTTGAGTLATKSVSVSPDSASGSHLIVEPLTGTSDPDANYKIQSKTNLRVLCSDAACTSYGFETWKKGADGITFTPDLAFAPGLPAGITRSTMSDYRLGRSIGVFMVDVAAVTAYANTRGLTLDNTVAIYVQTAAGPFDSSSNYTALVEVYNGAQLPEGGWTLASNGRVWAKGNFNLYDYGKGRACTTPGEWEYGVWGTSTCTVPPAAVFCDSFGVLSNEWAGYGIGVALGGRPVTTDVYINAAVITGTVPSQLVKGYPNCDGAGAGGHVDFTGCRYSDSQYALTTVLQPARVVYTGAYWKPLKSYEDGSGSMGDFTCTGGLNASGIPVTPASCEYWLDDNTGIYYYNNRRASASKSFGPYSPTYDPNAYVDNPQWDIPLFVAMATLYTKDSLVPYGASVSTSVVNMNGVELFPDTQIPASSVFPGMTHAWTLSDQFLYNDIATYTNLIQYTVSVDATSPETVPLKLHSVVATLSQPYKGAGYLTDFDYMPLWVPMYSGGLENLINLQESWGNTKTLHVRGNLMCLWDSVSLETTSGGVTTPAFYRNTYYAAPTRDYRFDTSLRTNPPPASPDVIEVQRTERAY